MPLRISSRPIALATSVMGTLFVHHVVMAQSTAAPEPPGITLQNLPNVQQIFRLDAVRAVDEALYEAAETALLSYQERIPFGWSRYAVPRGAGRNTRNPAVILLRVDDDAKLVEIAIRGTANFDDVMADLNAVAVLDKTLGVPLHSGFREIAVDVYAFLLRKLPLQVLKKYQFSLSGHSLGGAVAAIVSMYLHNAGSTVSLVATFGAPRFTTNEGARKYQVLNQRTYRVVRCDDVIPFMPPPNFLGWSTGSYTATGNLLLLLTPPYFDYSVGIDIERDFAHQLRTELANAAKRQNLAFGHRMDNYKRHLFFFTPFGMVMMNAPMDLKPISYRLALQERLCPPRLMGPTR